MINVKCFLLRLYLLTYSPLFPVLLSSTIFIVYRIYFEPVILCDGWDVMNLKYQLTVEIGKFRCADAKLSEYCDRCEQILRMPVTDAVQREHQIVTEKMQTWLNRYTTSLNKVRDIENTLSELDPNFRTTVNPRILFPRVSGGSGVIE